MYAVYLLPVPTLNPDEQFESKEELMGFVEEWGDSDGILRTGLAPMVVWHDSGTETVSSGTIS